MGFEIDRAEARKFREYNLLCLVMAELGRIDSEYYRAVLAQLTTDMGSCQFLELCLQRQRDLRATGILRIDKYLESRIRFSAV